MPKNDVFHRNEHGELIGGGFSEYDDWEFEKDELKWLRERRGTLKPEVAERLAIYDKDRRKR